MPRLWTETIETHRQEVRETILDATARLVLDQGPLSLTMSQIAEEAGIARATLYNYFADVEAILFDWHDRQVAAHLKHLESIRVEVREPDDRLRAVLEAFAMLNQQSSSHRASELGALLHRDHRVLVAQQTVLQLMAAVLSDAADAGIVRKDVSADELATYCLHSLLAAESLPSKAAVRRLVTLTIAGLRPGEAEALT